MTAQLQPWKPDALAPTCDAFHTALEPVVTCRAHDGAAAEAALWTAFDAYQVCYSRYALAFIPLLTKQMTRPFLAYYVFRRRPHDYLVSPRHDRHDTAATLAEVQVARQLHASAYGSTWLHRAACS